MNGPLGLLIFYSKSEIFFPGPPSPSLLLWIFKIYFFLALFAQKSFPDFFFLPAPSYSTVLRLRAYFSISLFQEGRDDVGSAHLSVLPAKQHLAPQVSNTFLFFSFITCHSSNIIFIFKLLKVCVCYFLGIKYCFSTSIWHIYFISKPISLMPV